MNIKIIDYKAGNSQSVQHAIARLGYESSFAKTGDDLVGATHIILPGVGSAKATMESLTEQEMIPTLEKLVLTDKIPFLGVCVGLQVLFDHSEEGDVKCLGWLPGKVKRFDNKRVRVPQMGWNNVSFQKSAGIIDPSEAAKNYYYFVNSYYAVPDDEFDTWGVSMYGLPFMAAVHRDNIYGTQFHVEKSGAAGLQLLDGFVKGGK